MTDPQRRNDNGLAFRLNGCAFVMAEAAHKSSLNIGEGDLPSTYKIGVWLHGNDFADQRLDNTGQSLASPASSGVPAIRHRHYGVYFIVDQTVWHKPDTG